MEAHVVEWLSLLGRWLHFVVGIAWIGSSLYFVWLDNHLLQPADPTDRERGVGGEVWSVHGGGFYHAQKYRLAPATLPEPLHWFKWEAYSTWLSGMFLLGLIYWYSAEIYLIDSSVLALTKPVAIAIGAAYVIGGWLVYDLLCRSPLGRNEAGLTATLAALLTLAAWSLCELFSGRGAYIHYGALIGTIMVGNVFFIIIPGQKRMVAATSTGAAPDPADGQRAKQRSVHNTYFTLPILFVMISNHYAMTYGHRWNWLILVGLTVAGALIRVWFVARHKGPASPWTLVAAGAIFAAIIAVTSPTMSRPSDVDVSSNAGFADVFSIVQSRCTGCHANEPTYPGFVSPPGGVVFETPDDVVTQANDIYQQSVVTRIMPVGNLTDMQDDERTLIGAWFLAGADVDWSASE
ncbi:MAG: urate hydroxylase PuuD [Pseudomonadota bacterium]